jgi:cytochrome b561
MVSPVGLACYFCARRVPARSHNSNNRGSFVKFFLRVRRYTWLAMLLHWLVAAGIAFLYVHGFYMMGFEVSQRLPHLNLHRSVGVVVFVLVLVRALWRTLHPPPQEAPMPALQAWIATYVHLLIYVLLIANGIAGTAGWVASGDPIVFFGVPLTGERTPAPDLNRLCILVGLTTARALLVVIVLHVLAVIKHEWLDKDRLLSRMLPGPAILLPLRPGQIVRRMREWRRRRREQRALRGNGGTPTARQ